MSELKVCPCCNKTDFVGSFTVDLMLGIVMFGCSRCAFLAKNRTVWQSRSHENKIKAVAVREAAYEKRTELTEGGVKWLCRVDDLLAYADELERGEL